jgi:glycosyltransferase involved in cell wall biosynthesis
MDPTTKKYKIVTISDHILSHSGVALQSKYIIEHLLKTGKFQVISICVAMKHDDMRLGKTHEFGDDLLIVPALRYDDQNLIRQIIDAEKPDALWIMTDPRFYAGLFAMADEVRRYCPILWNCIWDNPPTPWYNKPVYDCIDFFGCINKVMFNIANDMGYSDRAKYLPHGVREDEFKILTDSQSSLRKKHFGADELQKVNFVLFYNSRNALRKRTNNVIMAYKLFRQSLPEEERNRVFMCMHTPPKDPEGSDLFRLIDDYGLKGTIGFSGKQVPTDVLVEYYNLADVTVIQSSEEGFGLSCLESLMCGTPVICGRTGGLQDQVYDPETKETFGVLMEPDATSIVGSQTTPYLESHHFSFEKTAKHIRSLYDSKMADPAGYKNKWAGENARASMLRRFNLNDITKGWEDAIVDQVEKFRVKQANRSVEITTL